MKLIVGLGNIGKEYEATRHNIGFMVLDELARRWGVNTWKNDRNALCGEYRIPEKVLLLKPTTYMNLSGVVSHVTEISSTVSLLTSENPSNQIPVMIINGDQTIYGLLKNYDVNKKVLNITLLSGIDKLEKNAKVYTSGLGGDGKCPKGIYIGKAKKLVTQSDGTTMTLTVKMAAQFKDLSYVSVVKKVNGNEELNIIWKK